MSNETTNTASDTPRGFTPEQCEHIRELFREMLANEFPHLQVTVVEMRDDVLCIEIEALPTDD